MLEKVKNKIKKKPQKHFSANTLLLASFPKTGSTFTRFVFANIINQMFIRDAEVNFYNLGSILPEVGKDNPSDEQWAHPGWPIFVKTHALKSAFVQFTDYPSIYIVRDPRDTMISYYNYQSRRQKDPFSGSFEQFITDPKVGVQAYNRHVEEWFSNATHIFSYEELMTSPFSLFRTFFDKEKIEVSDEILERSIVLASPDNVRNLENAQSRPGHEKNFQSDFKFVRNASVQQWKTDMSEENAQAIYNLSNQILKHLYTEA